MDGIDFRKCEFSDLEFILNLKDLCLKWYIEIIYGWDINVQRKLTYQELKEHKDDMRIIILDKKEVGVTTFYEENGKYIVGLIMVHPSCQGRKTGTTIINSYIDIARKEHKEILIKTYKLNPAKRLYERLGFEIYKEDETHVYLHIEFNK